MGEIALIEANDKNDLLALIVTAIEQLRRSVELFEAESRGKGIDCLSSVIEAIDMYMSHAEDDPLVRLAHIDTALLSSNLQHIKADLAAVIGQFPEMPAGEYV